MVQQVPEPGVVIRAEVTEGLPARVLLDRAIGADMLVLGTASHAAMRAAGPVVRACVSRAPCPVVVIGPEQAAPPSVSDSGPAERADMTPAGAMPVVAPGDAVPVGGVQLPVRMWG